MIPTNINVNIVNIIITRLDVPVNADDKREEEDDDDASSSRLLLELLFLFKKRAKLKLLLFEPCLVKRRSDRRSSSSFIVLSLARVMNFQVMDFPENVDTFCAENSDVKRKEHARDIHKERVIV